MDTIRVAELNDLPAIVSIYNQAILTHTATADMTPFTIEERTGWFKDHHPESHPIYVFEQDGKILGWYSVSPYRGRPALAGTAEISYYVDYHHHGRGIGSALMEYAIAEAPRLNKRVFIAILLEWNSGSIRLLEKFGFERWGYLPDVADFDGKLCGQYYYGRKV